MFSHSLAADGRRAFPEHGHGLDANNRGNPKGHIVVLTDTIYLQVVSHGVTQPTPVSMTSLCCALSCWLLP